MIRVRPLLRNASGHRDPRRVRRVLRAEAPFEPWKTSADPVAKLWERVSAGRVKLDVSSRKSWVRGVLRELNVPVESQVLVFSKSSLQNALINPQTPRSVFYNEDTYAGWAQGGMMELIGIDPAHGPQFYTMAYPESKGELPVLATSDQCLSCHESSRTNGVNGMLVRSLYVDADGQPLLQFGSYLSGHESPIGERWGGWYVTGRSGKDQHMGNVLTKAEGDRPVLDRAKGTNVMSLDRFFDTNPYLTKTSDIVSLMVLEHQCTLHNKMTDGAKSTREAMARQHDLQKAFNEPVTDTPQGSALTVIKSHAEKIVKHLLFCEEYALQDGGVEGVAGVPGCIPQEPQGHRGRTFPQGLPAAQPPLQIPLQLHDLLQRVRRPARAAQARKSTRSSARCWTDGTSPRITRTSAPPNGSTSRRFSSRQRTICRRIGGRAESRARAGPMENWNDGRMEY